MYDYFYGAEAEQFSFYRIPKVLFTEERFRSVSAEAKVLYGLLLDRMSLSCKNGWLDKEGRVYIIFTIEEVMTALGCADQKAGKLLHELESKCRLIERKRQGKKPKKAKRRPDDGGDLADALEASLKGRKPTRKTSGKRKKAS